MCATNVSTWSISWPTTLRYPSRPPCQMCVHLSRPATPVHALPQRQPASQYSHPACLLTSLPAQETPTMAQVVHNLFGEVLGNYRKWADFVQADKLFVM